MNKEDIPDIVQKRAILGNLYTNENQLIIKGI